MGCFNSLIFPRPAQTYNENDPNLKYIHPPPQHPSSKNSRIPCMVYENSKGADKLLIYFHGNAEDIGMSKDMIHMMMAEWNAHGVAVEYPTYGVYKDRKLSEKSIREDALLVYDTISKDLGVVPEQIIIVGRSIGSGAATYLASQRSCGAFLLVSPMKSVDIVAGEQVCIAKVLCCCTICPLYIFQNKDFIKKVVSSTYIVHGEDDDVINVSHGRELYRLSPAPIKDCNFIPGKKHTTFHLMKDIILPFAAFLRRLDLLDSDAKDNINLLKYSPNFNMKIEKNMVNEKLSEKDDIQKRNESHDELVGGKTPNKSEKAGVEIIQSKKDSKKNSVANSYRSHKSDNKNE